MCVQVRTHMKSGGRGPFPPSGPFLDDIFSVPKFKHLA